MSKAPTREEIREAAEEAVRYYSAVLQIPDKASVHKGTKPHVDANLEPTNGWWVDCQIFIPEDHLGDRK